MSRQKSTIVRIRNTAFKTGLRIADVAAPRVAGRIAHRLWLRLPPAMPATTLPSGGEAFEVTSLHAAVRGHVWGDGPVVYLVHGWGGRGSQMTAYVDPLVAAGFRVVLFDGPAHGDSDPGPAGAGTTHGVELGKALDAVAAKFGPAHTVVAHSLGAVATYLTLRYGWLSTRRLVLVAPLVDSVSLFDQLQHTLGFGARTRQAFDREVHRFIGIPVDDLDARVQARHVDPVTTLVLHDRDDRQASHDAAADLVRGLPDARLVTTEGLGHRRILRDPAAVARVVAFVRDGEREAADAVA